jgi:hypothetical protein
VAGNGDVGRGCRPLDRGDRQQRAPVDRDVRGRGVTAEYVAEAFGQLGVVVEAEHRVGLGQALGQLGAVALGEAADGHDLRPARRRRVGGREQRVDGVLLGLLDEPARVHDDDVGGA